MYYLCVADKFVLSVCFVNFRDRPWPSCTWGQVRRQILQQRLFQGIVIPGSPTRYLNDGWFMSGLLYVLAWWNTSTGASQKATCLNCCTYTCISCTKLLSPFKCQFIQYSMAESSHHNNILILLSGITLIKINLNMQDRMMWYFAKRFRFKFRLNAANLNASKDCLDLWVLINLSPF